MVTENTSTAAEKPELKRVMGSKLLYFFVIGDILGTGIYTLTGKVAGHVGGALWLPFLLAFLVAFLTATSYLELVGKYPKAAGAALYTHKAFGIQFLTFMVMFTVMCSGITSASTAAHGFGGTYLVEAFNIDLDWWMIATIAVVFIGMLAGINYIGVSESVKANVVLTIIELSGLLIIIGVGVFAVFSGDGEPSRLTEINTGGDSNWLIAVTGATSLAFFAMVGFEDSVNMAEECRNPVKIFPKVLMLGLASAAVIYILVAITSSILLSPEQLEEAGSGSLLAVLQVGAPGFPLRVFAFIGLIAVVNSALINMLMASRLVYGMANEGVIWRGFSSVHPFRRTPWAAILATSVLAAVLVATARKSAVEDLGSTTALLLLLVFIVVNIAVLVLRREKVEHKHFKAPTWAPVCGAVACLVLAIPGLSGKDIEYLIAGILLAVGALAWVVNWATLRSRGQHATLHPERLSEDRANVPEAIVERDKDD